MAELRYDIIGTNSSLTAAVKQSVASLSTLEQAATKSNKAIKNEIAPLSALRAELTLLNKQKLNIVDLDKLAKQNSLIQELEAEITRFGNVGKIGFDALGNALAKTTSSIAGLGKSLTSGLGVLRQIAYILPGIGVAGIFDLAFSAITAAALALDLFNNSAAKTKEELKAIADEQKERYGQQNYITSAVELSNLAEKVKLAKDGFLDKNKVLKEYNDTLGLTIGQVNSLDDAEKKIVDNGPNYLKFLLLKAKAEYAFKQAAQNSFDLDVQRNKVAPVNTTSAQQFFGPGRKQLVDPQQAQKQILTIDQLNKAYNKNSAAVTDNAKKVNVANTNSTISVVNNTNKQIDSLSKKGTQFTQIAEKTQKELEDFAKANGFNIFTYKPDDNKSTQRVENGFLSIGRALDDIFNKTDALNKQSGLQGYDLEVQKIKDKYVGINAEIDKQQQKLDQLTKNKILTPTQQKQADSDQSKIIRDRASAQKAQDKELSDAKIAEAKRVSNEIQRINDEFGVKSEQGRTKELASVEKLYNSELAKAKGNAELIAAIESGRLSAIQAVNDKYAQIVSDTYEKIQNIVDGANNTINDKEESRVGKVKLRYSKLQQEADKYYAYLRDLAAKGQPGLNVDTINSQQANTNAVLSNAKASEISVILSATFSQSLQQSINSFVSNFYDALTGLGKARQDIDTKYAIQYENAEDDATRERINNLKKLEIASTTSFGAIFSNIVSGFQRTFNQSIIQGFTRSITENLGRTLINSDPTEKIAISANSFSQIIIGAGQAFAASVTGSAVPALTGAGAQTAESLSTGASDAHTGLTKGAAAIAAAASVIGGVISGLGSPTNSVTQAAGGALSGAGEGALIGGALAPVTGGASIVIGAAIGGLVGLVGGLFGASKARKQLQEQQLEQQKQQTSLLKQSLAYTSNIIGRMTSSGVLTDINVGSTGQLTATVNGKDLQFVLDRYRNGR